MSSWKNCIQNYKCTKQHIEKKQLTVKLPQKTSTSIEQVLQWTSQIHDEKETQRTAKKKFKKICITTQY